MATYQVLYWHGIPTQVRARETGTRQQASVQLPARFMEAVDQAAMAARRYGADEYGAGFKWGPRQERIGTAQAVAEEVAAELDAEYAELNWRDVAAALKTQGTR